MNKKQLFNLIIVSFIVLILGFILSLFPSSYDKSVTSSMIEIGGALSQLFGILYIFKESNIKGTIYWKIISVLLSVLCIGILFKIMHWASQEILLMISLLGIPIVYFFRFLKKENKDIVDVFKVIWVFSVGTSTFLILLHIIPKDYRIINSLLFWTLFTVYGIQEYKEERK